MNFYKKIPNISTTKYITNQSKSSANEIHQKAELHLYMSMHDTSPVQRIASRKSTISLDFTSEVVMSYANYTSNFVESGIQREDGDLQLVSSVGRRLLKESTLNAQDFESGAYVPKPPKVPKQGKAASKENIKLQESGYASICTKFTSGEM